MHIFLALLVMGGVQGLAFVIWPSCKVGKPCKTKQTQEEYFREIIDTVVPPLTKYGRDSANFSGAGSLRGAPLVSPGQPSSSSGSGEFAPLQSDCVTPWLNWLNSTLGFTETQPAMVQEVMALFRANNASWARDEIGDLWNTPYSFTEMLQTVGRCARDNEPLHANLCAWLEDENLAPLFGGRRSAAISAAQRRSLSIALHAAVILERFSLKGMSSRKVRVCTRMWRRLTGTPHPL